MKQANTRLSKHLLYASLAYKDFEDEIQNSESKNLKLVSSAWMHLWGEKQRLPGTAGSAAARSRPARGGVVSHPPSHPRRSSPHLLRTLAPSNPPHRAATHPRISLLLST